MHQRGRWGSRPTLSNLSVQRGSVDICGLWLPAITARVSAWPRTCGTTRTRTRLRCSSNAGVFLGVVRAESPWRHHHHHFSRLLLLRVVVVSRCALCRETSRSGFTIALFHHPVLRNERMHMENSFLARARRRQSLACDVWPVWRQWRLIGLFCYLAG